MKWTQPRKELSKHLENLFGLGHSRHLDRAVSSFLGLSFLSCKSQCGTRRIVYLAGVPERLTQKFRQFYVCCLNRVISLSFPKLKSATSIPIEHPFSGAGRKFLRSACWPRCGWHSIIGARTAFQSWSELVNDFAISLPLFFASAALRFFGSMWNLWRISCKMQTQHAGKGLLLFTAFAL